MLSKLRKQLRRRISGILGLRIHHRTKERATLACRTKDKIRTTSPQTTHPSHKKRMVMGRQIRTMENGASSIRAHDTTSMNVARSNH